MATGKYALGSSESLGPIRLTRYIVAKIEGTSFKYASMEKTIHEIPSSCKLGH